MKRKPIITKVVVKEYLTTGYKNFLVYYLNKNPLRNDRVRYYSLDTAPKSALTFIANCSYSKTETKDGETITTFSGCIK